MNQRDPFTGYYVTMSMCGVRDRRGLTISAGRSRELGRTSAMFFSVFVALFQAWPYIYIGLAPETH